MSEINIQANETSKFINMNKNRTSNKKRKEIERKLHNLDKIVKRRKNEIKISEYLIKIDLIMDYIIIMITKEHKCGFWNSKLKNFDSFCENPIDYDTNYYYCKQHYRTQKEKNPLDKVARHYIVKYNKSKLN